ncbi:DUF5916 domain-containing protein [Balneola vulgaris]|uniref:DUF5916 domain-containing protein n=1 Tax=Balneola vulgaris TaxID=287535 RepID=UPI0003699AF0|nr:DUF5916 domain-containing protein [Balneola vulgaris]
MRKSAILLLLMCVCFGVNAQSIEPANTEATEYVSNSKTDYRFGYDMNPTMDALRIEDAGIIKLDGFINEAIWATAPVATGFTQRSPNDGSQATQKTEARILYTDKEIFVSIMAYDTAPDSIIASLFRRDGNESSDWVYASFDSYNDKRTAFTFAVNPRGVQKDVLYFDDQGEDILWDAVWEASAKITDQGWSVEMRIPLSQLRFSSKDDIKSWGVNFQRRIARNQEFNFWAPTPQNESGMVSKFGRLNGIRDLEEPRRLEVIPYTSSILERAPGNPNNPYYEKNDLQANIGGDIKYGLTSDLTLTATLNPDFGQVEADPATINLSQFEQFFPEKRPFFLEGSEIFRFGGTKTMNSFGNPNTFYSRRIGRAPQGSLSRANNYSGNGLYDPNTSDEVYTNVPNQTSILGAAKLSGKTQSGLSVGALYALTAEENSPFTAIGNSGSQKGEFVVQPSNNYLITRLKQDFNSGNTVVGGYFAGMNRDIDGTYFEEYLNKSAMISGLDFEHSFKDRTYVISGTASVSNIIGTTDAITRAQRAPQRYYQRVDSDELSVDANKTSLSGLATELSFQKAGGDHWKWSVTGSMVTPGYETNDIGFQNRADYRAINTGLEYAERNPKHFQFYVFWLFSNNAWNFDNDQIGRNYNTGAFFELKNLWSFNYNLNANFDTYSDRFTRGGPVFKMPGSFSFNFNVTSNRNKKVSGGFGQFHRNDRVGEYDHYYWGFMTFRPTTFMQLTISPEIGVQNDVDQYISTRARDAAANDEDLTYGNRYIFSDIRQANFSAQFRLNWTFNPKMSLQTYVRPFIAAGKYSNLKEFNKPGDFGFDVYGQDKGTATVNADGSTTIDPDGSGGEAPFTIRKQDFNVRSLQGNAVFRWEYRPGSTLFLVWQQQRSGFSPNGEFNFGRDFQNLFDPEPTNVFLVKLSYWFGT